MGRGRGERPPLPSSTPPDSPATWMGRGRGERPPLPSSTPPDSPATSGEGSVGALPLEVPELLGAGSPSIFLGRRCENRQDARRRQGKSSRPEEHRPSP